MKTYNNLYDKVCSSGNLMIAWRKARKGKTTKPDVVEFEKDLERNLLELYYELKEFRYKPKPLTTFILRDPKTRVISKSDFRDRIVHHALVIIIGKIFESRFIYDSCANQKGKGNLFAIRRFDKYARKATNNFTNCCFCLKADIKHYFQNIEHAILIEIIRKKIKDEKVIWLVERILENNSSGNGIGMPLGNLTSQFFANVYLNELDYFVKHVLRAKYYIRYVDDFIILDRKYKNLVILRKEIDFFLKEHLKISLHEDKSKIIQVYRGVDFVGFRIYWSHKLLRVRNVNGMKNKIFLFEKGVYDFGQIKESFDGWRAYALWAGSYTLREKLKGEIIDILWEKI